MTVLDVESLAELEILDVGCGVKFTRALLGDAAPVGHYFGVDVYEPVVEFLDTHVADERFTFRHYDVYNERYNPAGVPMGEVKGFPVGSSRFDVCTGYSLFTHLDPDDTRLTLSRMRDVAKPGGRAVFTVFLDEHSDNGHGWVDTYSAALGGSVEGIAKGEYKDVFEDDPLRVAMYDRAFLFEILVETGWKVQMVQPPSEFAQHTVVAQAE